MGGRRQQLPGASSQVTAFGGVWTYGATRSVFARGAKQAGDGPVDPAQPQGDLVLIPSSCVVRIETRPGVFELERDVARWREIELGDERGERVIVTRGLNGGERLVAAPPSNLNDGDRVLPKEGP